MLLKISNFLFELNKTDIESIQSQLTFSWATQKRLGNHQHSQKDGKWEQSINFGGKLIMQRINVLKDFEDMAKEGKPVRFTLGTGESFQVTIGSLSQTKSGFFKDGKHRYQEYTISLQRYFK